MTHENDLIWVVEAEPLEGYRLDLLFNNGSRRLFDCKPLMQKYAVFKGLQDREVFDHITLDGWTVTWADGTIDIAPEYLYEHSTASFQPPEDDSLGHVAEGKGDE